MKVCFPRSARHLLIVANPGPGFPGTTPKALRFVPKMEAVMALGKDLWDSAEDFSRMCGVQSAMAARFYALGRMLADAEVASLSGSDDDAAQKLRELQAYCEKLVVMLAPAEKGRPKLVAAA